MPESVTLPLLNIGVPSYSLHTVVVGTGAAGLKCADRLSQYGISPSSIGIVSPDPGVSTSALAGSDKMTFFTNAVSGRTPYRWFELN